MSTVQPNGIELPSQHDIALAQQSSRQLSRLAESGHGDLKIKVEPLDDSGESVVVPSAAFKLFVDILREMGEGRAISIIPQRAELPTQQAAEYLNVSRPFLIGLLEQGSIPFRMVGTHRRVLFSDVAAYKAEIDAKRLNALEELAAQAQELDMGY